MKTFIKFTWGLALFVTLIAMGAFFFSTLYRTGQGAAYGVILFVMVCVLLALMAKEEKL